MKKLFAGLLCIFMLLPVCVTVEGSAADTLTEVRSVVDDITEYQLSATGSSSVQGWINGRLTEEAGTLSEWYIIALSQNGSYDFSSYITALEAYLSSNNVASATSREKYALALAASGDTDNSRITETIDSSIGQQGIMSTIYGLHIINNGYYTANFTADTVIDELLSLQLSDGGWAVMGTMGDIDVTAMAIQALAPYYSSDSSVRSAVDSALSLLSSRQESSGGYSSFGTANPESSAQVMTALSALGIDFASDSRFIKGGKTLLDGILQYRLSDGTFSHVSGGQSNSTSTMQVYYSFISYIRMREGKSPLFVFDSLKPEEPVVPATTRGSTPTEAHSQSGVPSGNTSVTDTGSSGGTSEQGGEEGGEYRPDSPSGNASEQTHTAVTTVKGGAKVTATTTASSSAVTTTVMVTATGKAQSGTTSQASTDTSLTTSAKTALSSEASDSGSSSSSSTSGGYKIWVICGTVIAGGLVCMVLFAAGKKNIRNFIAVGAAAAVVIVVVLVTDIQSKESYYNGQRVHKDNAVGTVTMTIRCDTIVGKTDNEYVPKNGVILDTTEFDLAEGETVYDILSEAARTYGIQTENSGGASFVYISGINYIYELEYGDLSGWMYHVNGESPSVSCDEYVLSDGDKIEWLYTCDIGNDLGETK